MSSLTVKIDPPFGIRTWEEARLKFFDACLCTRMKVIRERKGLSEEWMADALGLKVGAVRLLERGLVCFDTSLIRLFCEKTGANFDYLMAK